MAETGTLLQQEDNPFITRFESFFNTHYKKEIERLVAKYPEKRSLNIDFKDIEHFDYELADEILANPDYLVEAAENAIKNIDIPSLQLEQFAPHIRIFNLPKEKQVPIRDISSIHLAKLIAVDGVVKQITDVLPKLKIAMWECRRCGNTYKILQAGQDVRQPAICQCKHKDFELVEEKSSFVDYQKIQIQEPLEFLKGNAQPSNLDLYVSDDIVNIVNAGDRIKISGILRLYEPRNKKLIYGRYLEIVHVEQTEKEFEEIEILPEEEAKIKTLANDPKIYEMLTQSIAPAIYGHDIVKQSIVLQLFGGVKKLLPDESKIRGNIHILLVGDPGAAKCVSGDTKILLGNGSTERIDSIVESMLAKETKKMDDGFYSEISYSNLPVMNRDCTIERQQILRGYKRKPTKMFQVVTASGKKLKVTHTHPLFLCLGGKVRAKKTIELIKGDFIATPRKVNVFTEIQKLNSSINESPAYNSNNIQFPEYANEDFARFSGYLASEGYILKRKTTTVFIFTNKDKELLEDFEKITKKLFNARLRTKTKEIGKETKEIIINSVDLAKFLELNTSEIMNKSRNRDVPQIILKSPEKITKHFIKAFIEAEGSIRKDRRVIEVTSASEKLIENLQLLLLRFGIYSTKREMLSRASNGKMKEKQKYFKITISGKQAVNYVKKIGFISKRKIESSLKIVESNAKLNTNIDIVPNLKEELKFARIALGLSQFQTGIIRSSYQHYEKGDRNPSREQLLIIANKFQQKFNKLPKEKRTLEPGEKILNLVKLAKADIFWDKIKEIKQIENEEWIYDFEVSNTHNFITNQIFSHNSMMLLAANKIAPKSLYISGKSTSGAGISATAVKDDFGEGGWTIKAGALVLASGGVAMVDEFDKMEAEDRSAMHEALEQQSYHKDFEIMFADGSTHKIGELVDKLMQENKEKIIQGKDCEILPVNHIELFSTNFKRIFQTKADRISRHKAPKHFIEITHSNGKKIKVTPDHQIFVFNENKLIEVPAEKVMIGMSIPGANLNEVKNETTHGISILLNYEIRFLKIVKVEKIENNDSEWVYDVTIEPTHNFISSGLVLHNSISVAKAGIVTRFKTETSVLAAANPKFSRFDPFMNFMEQINLPATLISRFDLFFMIRDVLDKEKDRDIAKHILETHRAGEILMQHKQKTITLKAAEKEELVKLLTPSIPPELFKKYISYARQKINPILARDAMQKITDFYVNLRDQGRKEGSYSATHRQLEGLIRLSEASARVRLSNEVTEQDADRAIFLFRTSLQDVVVDQETGKIDIDIITTGQSHSQTTQLKRVLTIIRSKAAQMDMVPIIDILEELKVEGMDKDKVMEIISKLRTKGEIYEPRHGFLKPTQKE
ncbi:MAG: LAGLIDADG family homing endonuclease [archaeon]|nr:LAGLIDADG family homing endonuclease [archaeon]